MPNSVDLGQLEAQSGHEQSVYEAFLEKEIRNKVLVDGVQSNPPYKFSKQSIARRP
ncbi:MAG: hypothetical protein QNK22_09275 [Xanthomonadales bacterium]|nr:hypothetical protein [Xanthomonadales bacterium]